jgi:hypothetical protein
MRRREILNHTSIQDDSSPVGLLERLVGSDSHKVQSNVDNKG